MAARRPEGDLGQGLAAVERPEIETKVLGELQEDACGDVITQRGAFGG